MEIRKKNTIFAEKYCKRNTENLCKIWLEPDVELAKRGDLTESQIKDVIEIAKKYRDKLISQWDLFKQGKAIKIIKIRR